MKLLKLSFACVALLLLLTLTACDGSEADAETSHDYHIWYDAGYEVEPECAFDGQRKYTCECGEVRFETVESVGHTWGDWYVAEEPTCTEPGLKKRRCWCQLTEEEAVPALGHTEVVDLAVEPTCTETGLTEGGHCSACGVILTAQEIVPAGHTEVTVPAVEPTCTGTGLTESVYCSVCIAVLTTREVVPALGHAYGDWYIVKNPTCTEPGLKERKCRCQLTEKKTIEAEHSYIGNKCENCQLLKDSEGLDFTSNGDGTCYVIGIGTCTNQNLVIPSVSPNGDSLTSITFAGTIAQWQAISKEFSWNDNTGTYTVHCTDGDLSKSES